MFQLWRERPLLQGVCLPVKEKGEETEEAREKEKGGHRGSGQGGVHGGHAHHVTLNFYLKY